MLKTSFGILATGAFVDENVQTNHELLNQVNNFDPVRAGKDLPEWLRLNFGILKRSVSRKSVAEMAWVAATNALHAAKLSPSDIDFLLLNTASGDYRQPTTATEVQGLLGMRTNTFAMEINMPCSGSIYALTVAKSMMESGLGQVGLVIGADRMTRMIDPKDFVMAGMFGDGAGAAVVGMGSGLAFRDQVLYSRADNERALFIQGGGSKEPMCSENLWRGDHWLKMKGPETSSFIESAIAQTTETLLKRNNLNPDQFIKVIPHQASKPLVTQAFVKLGFKPEQLHFTMERFGNTSAGSLIITLDDYLDSTPVTNGRVLLIGMGGGLNWGGMVLELS